MLYNLRSDIIYYKSGSDFELEFNLCGCCRMRLLTDKPSNKKAFVHSLARAVSRSRVIIIAGPIFGEENTIEIVSQALGAKTEVVDNAAYGISSDEEINIIKGALPLVSNDGSFGGCIIESGPQTMILLTDNKALRKNIMSSLIHPYIAELYTAELNQNNKPAEAPASEVETNETETTVSETNEVEVEETEIYLPQSETEIIPEAVNLESQEVTADDKLEDEDEDDIDEIPLILSLDDDAPQKDITEDDIFFDTPESLAENYAPENDITIDDLFPSTPELDEPIINMDEIDEKIEGKDIFMETEEPTPDELPEQYHVAFKNLFTDDEKDEDEPIINEAELNEYTIFDDNGELIDPESMIVKEKRPKLHIATIIFTVILLLAIIVLAYSIFSASTSEGMAPAQYIKEVWQTVFG